MTEIRPWSGSTPKRRAPIDQGRVPAPLQQTLSQISYLPLLHRYSRLRAQGNPNSTPPVSVGAAASMSQRTIVHASSSDKIQAEIGIPQSRSGLRKQKPLLRDHVVLDPSAGILRRYAGRTAGQGGAGGRDPQWRRRALVSKKEGAVAELAEGLRVFRRGWSVRVEDVYGAGRVNSEKRRRLVRRGHLGEEFGEEHCFLDSD
ncbi:uncharacterized protein CC84DRAFT_1209745 [Paraphaeosphaeria sporulosa]|uniref:Uncharacterized protein n=1 Tax=Paraphaeosphaeria sporulosa TaxID=1460663 RepID=A0A177C019_9PLEO|nr:uncharacterized protein CC84DRAFT_1209745 [Paraphaeosphaeria sporulosa]OAG00047.1 hypothetical protein CC84DRAFT_1209745 [Paraphaeosphaeria sporulosa]